MSTSATRAPVHPDSDSRDSHSRDSVSRESAASDSEGHDSERLDSDGLDSAGARAEREDPLPPLAEPEDRPWWSVARVVEAVGAASAPLHVVGAEGCIGALVGAALAAQPGTTLLYVTADLETARRAHADLRFALARQRGGAAAAEDDGVLLFTPSETNPYAQVHPDRQLALQRVATLHRLATGSAWRVLVTPAAALVRRVLPPDVLLRGSARLVEGGELDLAALVSTLSAAGYLRVPVVEDAGSFAVRGGLLDVWAPGQALPVRVELLEDLVLGLRRFDPETQRTASELREVALPPAREAIVDAESAARAAESVRALADAINTPSAKTRALIEEVASGRTFFGAEGFLPAYSELTPLWSYLGRDTRVLLERPQAVVAAIDSALEQAWEAKAEREGLPHFPWQALFVDKAVAAHEVWARPGVLLHRSAIAGAALEGELDALAHAPLDAPSLGTRDNADLERAVQAARSGRGKHAGLEPLLRRLALWRDAGLDVLLSARSHTQAERLATLLGHRGLAVEVETAPSAFEGDPARSTSEAPVGATPGAPPQPAGPATAPSRRRAGVAATLRLVVGPLARGVVAPAERLAWVTEEEIFGHRAHRAPGKRRGARSLLDNLRALSPGDFLVHVDHGIGRYAGLERRTVGGIGVELLVVEYAGGDKLYLPVHRLSQVQKYSGGEGPPRLDRLGGQSFAKTKAKVKRRVRDMADQLLRLYAERGSVTKPPLGPAGDEYAQLEASFPYEETSDQAAAISDVMADLASPRVMDRLVCGDVGFGKTEVALRAAFRMALAGRQTGVLCPTTVLAQQHHLTFTRRLADFPIVVRVLSRFQSKTEQQETLKALRAGKVDIVVGTHRLLSKDVHFHDLGLLVVDEEQRFGVTHKERIKQLRRNVDVLTLSATPIPRTLQMAVSGTRDMSIIATPPVDRRAVRTIVSHWDEGVVRDAVARELERGGQVFYVYNRVDGIYERAERVRELLPKARIAVGHGQLDEARLERTMTAFVDGEFDILVTTAIIESGLDIPRANTMIIDRADLFGLSQLYQLRGRVGRSSERAYCYLLVPPAAQLGDDARQRIEALERYTALGSGFQIATLDMELRGAGDLLGAEQSGFVSGVGFELFCQLLEEATRELRGETVVAGIDPELSFDVEALLPDRYIDDLGVRLSLYQRLSGASDEAEVDALGAEMEDRFGPAPGEARALLALMRLKTELRRLRVLACEGRAQSVTLHLASDTPLSAEKVTKLLVGKHSPYRLGADLRLTRRVAPGEAIPNSLALADKVLAELARCLE